MGLIVWGFVTQVGIPAVKGTALFPMFEGREAKLRRELERAAQEEREARLEKEIAAHRKNAEDDGTPEPVRAYRQAQRDETAGEDR